MATSGFAKASLQEIKADAPGTPISEPLYVQFNPATLKLTLGNTVEGGQSRGKQVRQFVGKSSTQLSFELIFDTADEATADGMGRSVGERTAMVERFVLPKQQGKTKSVPPRVRFQWGKMIIDGIISSLNIDFELFSPEGVALRAKMAVTIKEQDPKYQYAPGGAPGDKRSENPTADAAPALDGRDPAFTFARVPKGADSTPLPPGQPGTVGGGRPDRSATTVAGESLADFAARNGMPPAAWRAMAAHVTDPLSLPGGEELRFDSSLPAAAARAARAVQAGIADTVREKLGLDPAASGTPRAGLAVTAAGGVSNALATVAKERAETAAAGARQGFAASAAPRPAMAAAATAAPAGAASPAGPPSGGARSPEPPLDPRATSFGYGVPLRPRLGGAAAERAAATRGAVVLRPARRPTEVPLLDDPGAPPWVSLPARDAGRRAADAAGRGCAPRTTPTCGCHGESAHAAAPALEECPPDAAPAHLRSPLPKGKPCRCGSGS